MNKANLFLFFLLLGVISFAQREKDSTIKARNINYNDFINQYSINDTSTIIIQLFFDKHEGSAYGQMAFLPITLGLVVIPLTSGIGMGLTFISFPVFVNGVCTLVKYRKKKLLEVLLEYKETKKLPKWIRRKANRQLSYYDSIKIDY